MESSIVDAEIAARTRWDMPVLFSNPKCSISLNLPISNCRPTSVCSEVCYAALGRSIFRGSIVKSFAVDRLIELDAEHVAKKMVDDAAGRCIRIAGSGEILPRHAPLLSYVEQFGGSWWGMTRRVDTHKALPSLMFSIDASTPDSAMQYVCELVPADRRAYLRRPQDGPSPLECAVTFPVHQHRVEVLTTRRTVRLIAKKWKAVGVASDVTSSGIIPGLERGCRSKLKTQTNPKS